MCGLIKPDMFTKMEVGERNKNRLISVLSQTRFAFSQTLYIREPQWINKKEHLVSV